MNNEYGNLRWRRGNTFSRAVGVRAEFGSPGQPFLIAAPGIVVEELLKQCTRAETHGFLYAPHVQTNALC